MYYKLLKELDEFKDTKLDTTCHLLEAPLSRIFPLTDNTIAYKFKKVHSILDSIRYSLALLRADRYKNIQIASKIIRSVLKAQEQNPSSPHFGLWTYDLETDVYAKGYPEKNHCSAVAIPLFIQLKEFSYLMSPELVSDIEYALKNACYAIVFRNVSLLSTHIIIAETFITAACGEYFNQSDFLHYAINKITSFYHYNLAHGTFYIFNDVYNYSYALTLLHFAKKYVRNDIFLESILKIEDEFWEILSSHYDVIRSQFAGPAMNMPDKIIDKSTIDFFKNASMNPDLKGDIFSLKGICPLKYRSQFSIHKKSQYYQKMIFSGCTYPFYTYPQIATTLIENDYSIGSFSRCQCWNEAPFLVHFGTTHDLFTASISILNNGFNFSSAQFSIVQHFNYCLGHITLADNRANRHITYDPTNGIINTSDLRVRFEINGDISKLKFLQDKNILKIIYNDLNIAFNFSYVMFDTFFPEIVLSDKETLCFDLILYHGSRKKIFLSKLKSAIVSWAFYISQNKISNFSIQDSTNNGKLISTAVIPDSNTNIQLESLYKPTSFINIHTNNIQRIQNISYEEFVLNNTIKSRQYSYLTQSNIDKTFNIIIDGENLELLINSLHEQPENEMINYTKKVFSILSKNNVTIDIIKHTAIQLLIQAYAFYKQENIQFEAIIDNNSTNIQMHITLATDTTTILNHTIKMLKLLHGNYVRISEKSPGEDMISRIVQLIESEFSNPNLSLEYISNKMKISTYTTSRLLKKHTNTTYIDYITIVRIKHAKHLLENTDLSLEDISNEIGYTSRSTFFRAFRKITNETPAQYKRKIEKNTR